MRRVIALSTIVAALTSAGLIFMAPNAAGAVITTFGCGGASSCTLLELFAGGSIRVGTKLFADWELEDFDVDGVIPNPALIVVDGLDNGGLIPGNGIKFSGNGELVVVGADRLDVAIGFTVTELDPIVFMSDNSLTILLDAVVGTAFLTVGEFVAGGSGVGLGQKEVETDPFFSPPITTDAIEFTVVQQKLIIEKDILLQSSVVGDKAKLKLFEQRFSQLPEPNGSLMLCVGAGALWGLHRLRSRRAAHGHRISSI